MYINKKWYFTLCPYERKNRISASQLLLLSSPFHNLVVTGNKSMKKYKYRETNRRARFKKRNLGYFPLFDNPYPPYDVRSVDMHHVNRIVCVPLPHRTHMLEKGRDNQKHKQHCKEWIQKLYLIDIDFLLRP